MKGQQHVHAEGQIATIRFDMAGRSTRGNQRDINLLCKEIEALITNFGKGHIMINSVDGWIDNETKDCC